MGGWVNVADDVPSLSLTSGGGAGPPVCSIAASFFSSFLELISGCYLVQHCLMHAGAENLLSFVLHML